MPTDGSTFGLLSIGNMQIALPLSSLSEVVRCPDALSEIPTDSPLTLGAMDLRSVILPIIDLRAALGLPVDGEKGRVVVVISNERSRVGIVVDGARGVSHVPFDALQPVTTAASTNVLSHTFQQPNGDVTAVLDVDAILRLPGIPVARSGPNTAVATDDTETRRFTLLQCGDHVLALNVVDIHTTLPGCAADPSVLRRSFCRGTTTFREFVVPVIDPLALIGFDASSDEFAGANLVLELEDGYVVMAITKLLEIIDVPITAVLPLSPMATGRPELIEGVIDIEKRGVCFVLNFDAVCAEPDVVALSTLNTLVREMSNQPESTDTSTNTSATEPNHDESSVVRGPAYLSYTADIDLATPLDQVDEIIPFPRDHTQTYVDGPMLGLIVHRNKAVPMLSLHALLGREPRNVTCLLLVSTEEGSQFALAIDELRFVENLAWRDPDAPAVTAYTAHESILKRCGLIQLGESSQLLPDLDLRKLLEAVTPAPV